MATILAPAATSIEPTFSLNRCAIAVTLSVTFKLTSTVTAPRKAVLFRTYSVSYVVLSSRRPRVLLSLDSLFHLYASETGVRASSGRRILARTSALSSSEHDTLHDNVLSPFSSFLRRTVTMLRSIDAQRRAVAWETSTVLLFRDSLYEARESSTLLPS